MVIGHIDMERYATVTMGFRGHDSVTRSCLKWCLGVRFTCAAKGSFI
jgi:hypothetical protein